MITHDQVNNMMQNNLVNKINKILGDSEFKTYCTSMDQLDFTYQDSNTKLPQQALVFKEVHLFTLK